MTKKHRIKWNNTILINLALDVLIVIGMLLMIFSFGRVYQSKQDKKFLDDASFKYHELLGEYNYYREHSYILYGEDYYKQIGLLP